MDELKNDPFIAKREFSRIDTRVPFEIRLVPEEEKTNIQSRISGELSFITGVLPEPEDVNLANWLKILNNKLDSIMNFLMFQKEGFFSLPLKALNISGGGMSFKAGQNFAVGDVLEIKMMLNMFQPVAIYVYGKVVKTGELGSEKGYDTAIQFIEIDDGITNAIVRFVFEVQRGLLRQERGSRVKP